MEEVWFDNLTEELETIGIFSGEAFGFSTSKLPEEGVHDRPKRAIIVDLPDAQLTLDPETTTVDPSVKIGDMVEVVINTVVQKRFFGLLKREQKTYTIVPYRN